LVTLHVGFFEAKNFLALDFTDLAMWGLDIQAGGIEIQVHVPPSPLPFGSVWLAAGRQKPFGFVRYYFLRFLSDT
jgi:hypothetical protein